MEKTNTNINEFNQIFIHLNNLSIGQTYKIIGIEKHITIDELHKSYNLMYQKHITIDEYKKQLIYLRNNGFIKFYTAPNLFISITQHFPNAEDLFSELIMNKIEYGLNNLPTRFRQIIYFYNIAICHHISYVKLSSYEN